MLTYNNLIIKNVNYIISNIIDNFKLWRIKVPEEGGNCVCCWLQWRQGWKELHCCIYPKNHQLADRTAQLDYAYVIIKHLTFVFPTDYDEHNWTEVSTRWQTLNIRNIHSWMANKLMLTLPTTGMISWYIPVKPMVSMTSVKITLARGP